MPQLLYSRDDRNEDPNQSGHRRARFKIGWERACAGQDYDEDTLETLTWDNLGWRLGKLFGATSEDMIDRLHDWCVDQQERPDRR